MGEHDPRIDACVAKAEPFARPILEHLRALVHEVCPDADETTRWGMPFFVSGGTHRCATWPRSSTTPRSASGAMSR